MFNRAAQEDLIPFNPFDRLKGNSPIPEKEWADIDDEKFQKLLDACPNSGWHVLLCLCRYAGLRRGEALRLKWSEIEWEDPPKLIVMPEDGLTITKQRRRVVPIEPRLHTVLLDAFDATEPGDPHVVPLVSVTRTNIGHAVRIICAKAKIEYAKPFHTLRKNRETEWAQDYPAFVVAEWLGHRIEVANQHYLKVPAALYRQVAEIKPRGTDQSGQQPTDASPTTDDEGGLQNVCKTEWVDDEDDVTQVLINQESGRRDSNPQHSAWKADALPIELRPRRRGL